MVGYMVSLFEMPRIKVAEKSQLDVDTIICGDCLAVLKTLPAESIDFIFTSPPYADNRKKTYQGIATKYYVDWFLPISSELKRVLKPEGSFVLNIKERAEEGERQTYVLELILSMRKQGWLWTEEYIWHKKIVILVNGRTVFVMRGKDAYILPNRRNSKCIRTP